MSTVFLKFMQWYVFNLKSVYIPLLTHTDNPTNCLGWSLCADLVVFIKRRTYVYQCFRSWYIFFKTVFNLKQLQGYLFSFNNKNISQNRILKNVQFLSLPYVVKIILPKIHNLILYLVILCFYCSILLFTIIFEKRVILCKKMWKNTKIL